MKGPRSQNIAAPPGFFDRIDRLKAELDGLRPLPAEESRQLRDYFRVGLTYSSNAIEGNSLDLVETRIVIEEGITIGGKPVRDHLEAIGHAAAYDHLLALAEKPAIREQDARELHRLFYARIDPAEAGRYRRSQVYLAGSEYLPPAADRVPGKMRTLFRGLAKRRRERHPVSFAAWLHYELVSIHPFIDGNGRTARLAMNLALLQAGYPVVSIPPVRRGDYLRALQREQLGRLEQFEDSFEALIADLTQSSLHEYLRLIRR
ncbi:MAG: Fic family protein [Blastocatellia bacterium]|nr:Fic family protein [Blastocatellia bacterium]